MLYSKTKLQSEMVEGGKTSIRYEVLTTSQLCLDPVMGTTEPWVLTCAQCPSLSPSSSRWLVPVAVAGCPAPAWSSRTLLGWQSLCWLISWTFSFLWDQPAFPTLLQGFPTAGCLSSSGASHYMDRDLEQKKGRTNLAHGNPSKVQ